MISILAQERLLGAALGSVFVGAIVFEQRMGIYKSISTSTSPQEIKEAVNGKKLFVDLPYLWNKSVDETLGPVIAYLGSRGW
ncbi:hypothetical protein J5N97_024552 [Dioscorea zingiberensis]|uniref:Uncharacterized protein n=1 Tax=Dioscorea zingiberensis TaxID=325984 RepID=A0A9D5H919_9LILI|nr:hypothetical protein J5N97_024552 [Dioscorea zingiberensis]